MGYEVGPFPQELNELAWSLAQKDSMFADDITDNGPWQQRMLDGEEEVDVAGDHHPAPSEDDDEDGDTDDAGVRLALAFSGLALLLRLLTCTPCVCCSSHPSPPGQHDRTGPTGVV